MYTAWREGGLLYFIRLSKPTVVNCLGVGDVVSFLHCMVILAHYATGITRTSAGTAYVLKTLIGDDVTDMSPTGTSEEYQYRR